MRIQLFHILLLVVTLTVSVSHSSSAEEKECLEAIRTELTKENPNASKEFFNLQSRLTLHRLAWAHLSRVSKLGIQTGSNEIPRLENEIKKVLEKISKKTSDPNFLSAKENFTRSPLSRKTLSDALESLSLVLKDQSNAKPEELDYLLHLEDLKTISILGELEDLTQAKSSQFTKSHASATSILHLTKIINSAYQTKSVDDLEREKKVVSAEIKRLEKQQSKWVEKLAQVFEKEPSCSNVQVCPDCSKTDEKQKSLSLELILKALHEDLKKNDYQGVRYGEVWLRTAAAPKPTVVESGVSESNNKITSPIKTEQKPEKRVSPPARAKTMKFRLDPSFMNITKEENAKMVPVSVKMKNAVEQTLILADQLSPCIKSFFPKIAANPLPYVRAAAIIQSELKHPILRSGWKAVIPSLKWYFSNPNTPDSPKECAALKSSTDPKKGTELLGFFDYWSQNPKALKNLQSCKYSEEQKLIFSALIHIGELNESSFSNCTISEDVAHGMKTHRKLIDAIQP